MHHKVGSKLFEYNTSKRDTIEQYNSRLLYGIHDIAESPS